MHANEIVTKPWTHGPNDIVRQRNSWERYLRRPNRADVIAMHRLVASTRVLDVNSTYAYMLMATDFADTTIVADRDGDLRGLITAYHPPTRPEVLFVWQVAVAESARGTGLAGTMLDALVQRVRDDRHGHPITVETTVAPGNAASRALFNAFARRHRVRLTEHEHFSAAHLDPDAAHDDEPLLRIGPIAD
ncbi:diaminobutyrate acetyltransferase [Mycobacterium sp. GA-2829]|uniref:diaminobutyrate acetyltransferase n=1 Tax=Mycobacterium sp. GA-2829 TaxID=1772283 RepID=UPI00073FF07D|nr:diaminobutyrate acetyltransferase [Mycobacterium sp. GA-2829]KUI27909.1 L-2,4-diaminobutyric acid acetyltransferase [Mycobacterium sp. GA-2829]